jgi:hypothetical protein
MSGLTLEYSVLVFVAACGVLQGVAAHSNLKGLLFFERRIIAYAFSALAIGGVFGWFFLSENRNVPGIEGSQQFFAFNRALFLALVFTFVISSALRRRLGNSSRPSNPHSEDSQPGMGALRQMTYFQAISRGLGRWLARRGR